MGALSPQISKRRDPNEHSAFPVPESRPWHQAPRGAPDPHLSLATFIPRSAEALPACGTHKNYYSNAAHTTQVGYRYYTCAGVLDPSKSWGTTSPYVVSNTYCCLN